MKIKLDNFHIFCIIISIFVGIIVPLFISVGLNYVDGINRELKHYEDNLDRIADSFEYYNQRRF
jgi:hypothetical protein